MCCHSVGSVGEPSATSNAIGYAQHYSRSHDAVIRVYDGASNVINTHKRKGEFQRAVSYARNKNAASR